MNEIAPQDILLMRLPRKLKITGSQPRSFRVMTRVKLHSLPQLVKAL